MLIFEISTFMLGTVCHKYGFVSKNNGMNNRQLNTSTSVKTAK